MFTGNLVSKGTIGRTNLQGSDGFRIKESIKGLMDLDMEWLLAGHGEIIAGAGNVKIVSKRSNPFIFGTYRARSESKELES